MRVFDCFRFFNEKELLELKYHVLKDYIEKFIVFEGTKTFSGNSWNPLAKKFIKELNLPEDKFIVIEIDLPGNNEKIENLDIDVILRNLSSQKINDTPQNALNARTRERMQMDALLSILNQFKQSDIFIISDCDEIVKPNYINYFAKVTTENPELLVKVPMVELQGNAALRSYDCTTQQKRTWSKTLFCTINHLKNCTPAQLRYNLNCPYPETFITENGKCLDECGWHFSWMGGHERVKLKAQSTAHYSDNISSVKGENLLSLENQYYIENWKPVENTFSPYGCRNTCLKNYPIDELPKQILEIKHLKDFFIGND